MPGQRPCPQPASAICSQPSPPSLQECTRRTNAQHSTANLLTYHPPYPQMTPRPLRHRSPVISWQPISGRWGAITPPAFGQPNARPDTHTHTHNPPRVSRKQPTAPGKTPVFGNSDIPTLISGILTSPHPRHESRRLGVPHKSPWHGPNRHDTHKPP